MGYSVLCVSSIQGCLSPVPCSANSCSQADIACAENITTQPLVPELVLHEIYDVSRFNVELSASQSVVPEHHSMKKESAITQFNPFPVTVRREDSANRRVMSKLELKLKSILASDTHIQCLQETIRKALPTVSGHGVKSDFRS